MKDQLKKKPLQDTDFIGKSKSDPHYNLNVINQNYSVSSNNNSSSSRGKESGGLLGNSNSKSSPPRNLTDSDWTELLSVPSKSGDSVGNRGSNGVSGAPRERRDWKRQGALGMRQNVVALDGRRVQKGKSRVLRSERKSDAELENKVNGGGVDSLDGRGSDARDGSRTSSSSGESLIRESRINEGNVGTGYLDRKDLNASLIRESKNEDVKLQNDALGGAANEAQLQSRDDSASIDAKLELKKRAGDDERLMSATRLVDRPGVSSRVSDSTKRSSLSRSNEESDSETDSGSSSGSESEREREEKRKRRQQILAEKAAAKAIEAIKERENNVARLEGEKQSLEKILEERAKQQVLEVDNFSCCLLFV